MTLDNLVDTIATYINMFQRTHGFLPPFIYLSSDDFRILDGASLATRNIVEVDNNTYEYHWTGGNPILLYREGYTPDEHKVVKSGQPLVFNGTLVDGLFFKLNQEVSKFGRVIYASQKVLPPDNFYCIYYSNDKRVDTSRGIGTQFQVRVPLTNGTTQIVTFQPEDNSNELLRLKTALSNLKDLVV